MKDLREALEQRIYDIDMIEHKIKYDTLEITLKNGKIMRFFSDSEIKYEFDDIIKKAGEVYESTENNR